MHTEDSGQDPGTQALDISVLLSNPELDQGELLLKQLRERTVLEHLARGPGTSLLDLVDQLKELEQRFESLGHVAHRVLSRAAHCPEWPKTATAAKVAGAWRRAHEWAVADPARFSPPSRQNCWRSSRPKSPHTSSSAWEELAEQPIQGHREMPAMGAGDVPQVLEVLGYKRMEHPTVRTERTCSWGRRKGCERF